MLYTSNQIPETNDVEGFEKLDWKPVGEITKMVKISWQLLDKLQMSVRVSKALLRTKEEARQTLLNMCEEHLVNDVSVVEEILKKGYK